MAEDKTRVYLVDDSLVARLALEELLVAEGMEIVGTAASGARALREIPRLRPDVVLMDVLMPQMDGLECTRRLMAARATPILIVSDLVGARANLNFEALEAGALDLCTKPTRAQLDDDAARARFARLVRLVAEVPVVTRRPASVLGPRPAVVAAATPAPTPRTELKSGLVGPPSALFIGASTGGPPALRELLAGLRHAGDSGPPMVIVQHMTRGFLEGLAGWLAEAMDHEVELARHNTRLRPGSVVLAPDGWNVEVDGDRVLLIEPPPRGPRPSIDVLFHSAARRGDASHVCAILLTGMGRDGARGLEALHREGAWTIAQDEATSVVWGMPRAAVELGAAREILPLAEIRARIHHWWRVSGLRSASSTGS
jgi:two-component system chemotaxis response regulator CheB